MFTFEAIIEMLSAPLRSHGHHRTFAESFKMTLNLTFSTYCVSSKDQMTATEPICQTIKAKVDF